MLTVWLLLTVLYLGLLGLKAAWAAQYVRRLKVPSSPSLAPGQLTLAQPILSGDPALEARLEENLRALPDQHFLWLIDEDDLEGRRIAEVLRQRYPEVAIRIDLCPPCPERINPKVWKLQRADGGIPTPFLGVLDDDTTLPRATAAALVCAARHATVATGLPAYLHGDDLPSTLLAQFVNNNAVFTYLGTSCLVAPFTLNGMGYVLRTEEVTRLDGFRPILHELTDDLALATLVRQRGGHIHQSPAPLWVQTSVCDRRHYIQLMHRWYLFSLLLLRRQTLQLQGLIFVLHGLPPVLLGLLVLMALVGYGHGLLLGLAVILVGRHLVLRRVQIRHYGLPMVRAGASLLSELLQPLHLAHALLVRTIRWRKRRYLVRDSHDFAER